MRDGWNLTGDAFVRDQQGRLSFVARSDDMIISSGYNIAGPDVEAALLTHPAVAECGVVGAPDDARGMIVKAYVVLAPDIVGDAALATALQDHVKREIAPYKYPRAIEFVARAAQDRNRQAEAICPAADGPGRRVLVAFGRGMIAIELTEKCL